MHNPVSVQPPRERLEELGREAGMLLIVFAPLDAAIEADRPRLISRLLIFALLGACVYLSALISEQRRGRVN